MSSKQDNHDKSNTPKSKRKKQKKKKNRSDDDEPELDEKLDNEKFQKMLGDMFPSNHQNKKINDIKKKKKNKKTEDSDNESEYNPEDDIPDTDDSLLDDIFEQAYEKERERLEAEEDSDDSEEEDSEYDEENDDEIEDMRKGFQGMKFNIVFTDPRMDKSHFKHSGCDEQRHEDEDDEDYENDEEEAEEAEEEEEELLCGLKEASSHMKRCPVLPTGRVMSGKKNSSTYKKNEKIQIKLDDWDKKYKGIVKRVHLSKKKYFYDVQLDESDDEEYELVKKVPENKLRKLDKKEYEYGKLVNEMKDLIDAKNKGGKAFKKKIEKMKKAAEDEEKKLIEKEIKTKKQKNFKSFKKLLRGKRTVSDIKYFKSLDIDTQENIMKKMKEVQEFSNDEKPHKFKLMESQIPVQYKSYALRKLESLKWMDPGSGEYYKIKQWVDTFMKIPFGKYSSLPVTLDDGVDKCREFMENAKKVLDDAVYGLDDAKMQIMQLVGQWISNPKSTGTAIAIKGPMGTGKTTLVKEGVSKILNRPF